MKAPRWLSRLGQHRLWLGSVVFIVLLIACALIAPRDRTVSIEAQTEILTATIPAGDPLSWDIAETEIAAACTSENSAALTSYAPAERRLVLRGPIRVVLTKAADKGILNLEIIPDTESCAGKPVAYLTSPNALSQLPLYGALHVTFAAPAGEGPSRPARVFRLRGVPTVGVDIHDSARHLLLAGQASISERLRWDPLAFTGFRSSYIADTRELVAGDRIVPVSRDSDGAFSPDEMTGFIRVADDSPMQVSLQGPLDVVRIHRFSDTPIELRGTIWTRIRGDALLSYLIVILSAILFLVQFVWQAPRDEKGRKGT
jgi:hypothetical protein